VEVFSLVLLQLHQVHKIALYLRKVEALLSGVSPSDCLRLRPADHEKLVRGQDKDEAPLGLRGTPPEMDLSHGMAICIDGVDNVIFARGLVLICQPISVDQHLEP
jgi:hypothetical protein